MSLPVWVSTGCSHSPKTKTSLTGDTKLLIGVKVGMNGCLSLCQPCDRMEICRGGALPLSQCQLGLASAFPHNPQVYVGVVNGLIDGSCLCGK